MAGTVRYWAVMTWAARVRWTGAAFGDSPQAASIRLPAMMIRTAEASLVMAWTPYGFIAVDVALKVPAANSI